MPRVFRGPLFLLLFLGGCGGEPRRVESQAPVSSLRIALHMEPQTWNRLLASDRVTHLVTDQLHAPLARLDLETQRMEPALAESWEFSRDGKRLTFHLRKGLRFSDGSPATARDVAFTFRALYDPSVASPLVETAEIDGGPFGVEVVDETTVAFDLPRRTASVERVFDSIPILPAHLLEESLSRGSFAADSGLGAPAERIVGLGPFALRERIPGERIVLERNPYYWKPNPDGGALPRLSRLVFEIAPDENARLLRFRAGDVDVLELVTTEVFEHLRGERDPDLDLIDLGPGLLSERLWFNLNPNAPVDEGKKRWFADDRFRRAVSKGIDRREMARIVFSERATPAAGPVSVGNRFWRDPSLPEMTHDPDSARKLLSEAGFQWDAAGALLDRDGRAVKFTVVTNTGSDQQAQMGAFMQEDLRALGIDARTVPIEGSSLLARITRSFDYEACLLGIAQTDPDPSSEMALWLSRGSLHLWYPGQVSPATPWEARIDELMEQQSNLLDHDRRRDAYFEVQRIISEHLPLVDLVAPHVLVAVHRRVRNLRPTPLGHILWNGEQVFVEDRSEKATWAIRDSRH